MDSVITAISVLLAVAFGWFLNQRSANRDRKAADEKQERLESTGRALDAIESADAVAREAAGVGHGVYLGKTTGVKLGQQFTDAMDVYNRTFRELELRIVRVRVLGPDWFVQPLVGFQKHGDEVMKDLMDSQSGDFTEEVSKQLQASVTKFICPISG